jgi:hypothetical protein
MDRCCGQCGRLQSRAPLTLGARVRIRIQSGAPARSRTEAHASGFGRAGVSTCDSEKSEGCQRRAGGVKQTKRRDRAMRELGNIAAVTLFFGIVCLETRAASSLTHRGELLFGHFARRLGENCFRMARWVGTMDSCALPMTIAFLTTAFLSFGLPERRVENGMLFFLDRVERAGTQDCGETETGGMALFRNNCV